nr:craniofacial development protein 2-like [Pelodiscus sinensis]|eukprot:XP_014435365.2 craniofacial development protein 2-like [Pelodiscus sinensis]
MYDIGKLAQIVTEMRQYNLHVLGVSESRWTGLGRLKTSAGETVLYSGRDDDQNHEGLAIILKKGIEKCLLEWKPVNRRLMRVRLKGRQVNITLIQVYAPTNNSGEEIKDIFYEQLQAEVESTPHHDLTIIMGDLNAKVGNTNTHYDRVTGRHGCGTMNDNGERLVGFCSVNNLVIGRTLFPHHNIHKLTWFSPNGRDKNQIDHLMINGTWRHCLQDVKGEERTLVVITI